MAAAKKNHPADIRRCGECTLGTWVTEHRHLDVHGRPICLRCPHSKFYIVRSQHACEHFKTK